MLVKTMPRKFNELKLALLQKLEDDGSLTSKDVAEAFNMNVCRASTNLKRLHTQKLVKRIQDPVNTFPKPAFRYYLLDRGRHRLEYLKEKEAKLKEAAGRQNETLSESLEDPN